MKTVRSAVALVIHTPSEVSFAELPMVMSFLKEFISKDVRFQDTLSPRISLCMLLAYLKNLSLAKELSLKPSTYKTVASHQYRGVKRETSALEFVTLK